MRTPGQQPRMLCCNDGTVTIGFAFSVSYVGRGGVLTTTDSVLDAGVLLADGGRCRVSSTFASMTTCVSTRSYHPICLFCRRPWIISQASRELAMRQRNTADAWSRLLDIGEMDPCTANAANRPHLHLSHDLSGSCIACPSPAGAPIVVERYGLEWSVSGHASKPPCGAGPYKRHLLTR